MYTHIGVYKYVCLSIYLSIYLSLSIHIYVYIHTHTVCRRWPASGETSPTCWTRTEERAHVDLSTSLDSSRHPQACTTIGKLA